MDTKLKKYSLWQKAVCIVLSVLMAASSGALIFNIGRTINVFNDEGVITSTENYDYTFLQEYSEDFSNVLWSVNEKATVTQKKKMHKYFADNKEKLVNEQLVKYQQNNIKNIKDLFEYIVSIYNNSEGDWYDDDGNLLFAPDGIEIYNDTVFNTNYAVPKLYEKRVEINKYAPKCVKDLAAIINGVKDDSDYLEYMPLASEIISGGYVDGNYSFIPDFELSYDGETYKFNYGEDADAIVISPFLSDSEALKHIDSDYDYFVSDYARAPDVDTADNYLAGYTRVKYYAKNNADGTVVTNFDGSNPKSILSLSPYGTSGDYSYYSSVNGDVSAHNMAGFNYINRYSGVNDSVTYDTVFSKDITVYIAIDQSEVALGSKDADISDNFDTTYLKCQSMLNQNYVIQIVAAVLLLVISIALLIFVLKTCGEVEGYDGIKRPWVDYIPTDIHLALSGLCIAGAVFIMYAVIDSTFAYTVLYLYAAAGVSALIWAIFTEFMCSFVRVCKSPKHLYKNCLIWWVISFCFKVIVKFFKFIGRLAKRLFIKTVNGLSYSPKSYKRNMVIVFLLYVVANIISLMVIISCMVSNNGITGLLIILYILGNGYVVYRVMQYIVNLDKIIIAASQRVQPDVDFNKLPKSLQSLVESIKYTNEELQNAVNKAVKDERTKTELITNVSHDLKTPLTSIITYADLLSKCDIEDEKAKEYIEVLSDKGQKLKRLIEDLIEASKVSTGNVTLNITQINLSELAAQAIGENQTDFEKAGLELVWQDSDKDMLIYADGSKTYRIIENLMSNAKKYSAKGSRVYASAYMEGDNNVFEIKNISSEPLNITAQELTERFVRGDESRSQEGNGLGLSIAKELCSIQNGSLDIIIDGDLFKARVVLPAYRSDSQIH